MTAKAAECRRAPREDVLSKLALAELDGERLSDAELGVFCLTLLVAGNETTRNLISGGMRALLEHRAQWEKLCADPALLPNAVEEMLRYVAPDPELRAPRAARHRARGQEAARRRVRRALLRLGEPRRGRLRRGRRSASTSRGAEADRHLAFGFGEHLCLGASLARLEARVMFEELIARGAGFSLAGPVRSRCPRRS